MTSDEWSYKHLFPVGGLESQYLLEQRVFIDGAPDAPAVRQARVFAAETLRSWRFDGLVDVAELLISELVTNAVMHARTPFRLALEAAPPAVTFEVHDGSMVEPRMAPPDERSLSGRGLVLVDSLAAAWGWRPGPLGKVVWFSLGS